MLKPPAFSRILVMLVGPSDAGASAGGDGTAGPVIDGAAGAAGAAGATGATGAAGAAAGAWAKILVQWEREMSRSVSEKRG